jgi:hypothetical protein
MYKGSEYVRNAFQFGNATVAFSLGIQLDFLCVYFRYVGGHSQC